MNQIPVPRDIPLPLPAPEPVLIGVLVVFFLMHIVFVNFMVGGALLTLWYQLRGLKEKRYDDLAYEIASTITANKSIAVVLGVGPLLAINTIYTVYFYTANALTGAGRRRPASSARTRRRPSTAAMAVRNRSISSALRGSTKGTRTFSCPRESPRISLEGEGARPLR